MIPTPEEQVQVLRNIQRLLAEGLFTASYKFALLHGRASSVLPSAYSVTIRVSFSSSIAVWKTYRSSRLAPLPQQLV